MKSLGLLLLGTVLVLSFSTALSKDNPNVHKKIKLSESQHYSEDEDHEHDAKYDHEAFLGKEEAEQAEELSPEESKEKLSNIFDKIDGIIEGEKADGFVSEKELHKWITKTQFDHVIKDTEAQWKEYEITDNVLKWENYVKKSHTGGDDSEIMKKRDQKKWAKADKNQDGHLNYEEFMHFLHPEEFDHMKSTVVDETMEDMDKNKDNKISLEEYMGDGTHEHEEPDKKEEEIKEFKERLDTNKDGYLDLKEVYAWEFPGDTENEALEETKHLMGKADTNMDQKLTKEEMLESYELFVGSQAANFGQHDEL